MLLIILLNGCALVSKQIRRYCQEKKIFYGRITVDLKIRCSRRKTDLTLS